jgi:uncharacterized protein YabN with tetrapyrrole methylase and pyrophosphatase domain
MPSTRNATHRFRDRFHHIERRLAERGKTPSQMTLAELDALWEEAKARLAGDAAVAAAAPTPAVEKPR